MECEIILIGNELLIGKIQDSNGLWIIHQLVPLGVQVSRITTIPDNIEIIAETLRDAIARKPAYIFTSGGLGPTFDDMTLQGVANGLTPPRSMEENSEAIEMIRKAYLRRFQNIAGKDPSLTPARRKMGILPQGSVPLSNSEGTAPGVYIAADPPNAESIIVCLPGVPAELIAIFQDHILPEIAQQMENQHFYESGFIFQDLGESKFTEVVYQIKDEYPQIWIKTHPRSREKLEVELHLTSFSQEIEIPEQMRELYDRLKQHILDSGGVIIEEHPLA